MSDKLQLETGDALLQEDGSSFILTIAAVDAPKTYPPVEVPPSRRPLAIAALTISLSLLQSTLAPAAAATVTVTQSTTLIQAKKPAPPWDPPNLLTTTLAPAAAEKPFAQRDWPVPPSRRLQWQVTSETRIGADDGVVAGDPVKPIDWPLPQSRSPLPRPVATQQFIGYYVFTIQQDPFVQGAWDLPPQRKPAPQTWTQNLLETTLSAPAELPPIRQHVWPTPRGKDASLALRTWTHERPFYYTEPPLTLSARPKDWPNPLPRKPAPQTWVQNLLQGTLSTPPAIPPPIRQHIWPVPPARPVWQVTSDTRIGADDAAVVVGDPFHQHNWPLPARAGLVLVTVSEATLRPTAVEAPFTQTDWPTPRRPRTFDLRWSQNLLESTLSAPVDTSVLFRQRDWPLPRGPLAAVRDLRAWVQRPAVPLAIPEIRQYDWPNPRVKPAAFDLKTWIQPRPSFYTEPKPFAQLDWPNPKPFKPAPRDWTQSPDVPLGIPLRPLDWPLPRIKASSIDLKTWIQKRPTYYVDTTAGLVVTIHTVGLDVFQTVGAGLDIRPDPGAGLDVYATGTAGLDISATPSAGVSDRAAPAGLDSQQSLPAGLSDAT